MPCAKKREGLGVYFKRYVDQIFVFFTKLIMLGVKYFGGNMVIFCQVLSKNTSLFMVGHESGEHGQTEGGVWLQQLE